MSKASLKKELSGMDKDQLIQMLLDAYSARKEIKEYLDFFLDPDVKKLTEKYRVSFAKEIDRTKYHYSKMRVSHMKKMLKDYASYRPGFEAEIDMLMFILAYSLVLRRVYFTETQIRYLISLVGDILDLADTNLVVDETLERLDALVKDETLGSPGFRRMIKEAIESYMATAHPSPTSDS